MSQLYKILTIAIITLAFLCIAAFTAAAEAATSTASITRIHHIFKSKHFHNPQKKLKKVVFVVKKYNYVVTSLISVHNIVEIVLPSIITYCMIHWDFHGGALAGTLIVITILMLFFGEIFPKIWGRKQSEKFSITYILPIYWIYLLFYPINALIFKFFKINHDDKKQLFSETELKTLFSLIKNEGVLEETERQMVQSAIEFDDTTIKDCYTPWDNIFSIYEDEKPSIIIEFIKRLDFDYPLPILSNKTHQPIGWLNIKDFLLKYMVSPDFEIDDIILDQKIIFVYDNEIKSNVLLKLQKNKQWYAIVQNSETNNVIGMISAEDLFSIVVGDVKEQNIIDDFVEHLEDGTWKIHPLTPLRLLVKSWRQDYSVDNIKSAKEQFFYQWINNQKNVVISKILLSNKQHLIKYNGKYLKYWNKVIDKINYFIVEIIE